MANVFDTLKERGFIAQCTNEKELRELFDKERVTFYIGFDPTADSLHAGHFIALMAMAHHGAPAIAPSASSAAARARSATRRAAPTCARC